MTEDLNAQNSCLNRVIGAFSLTPEDIYRSADFYLSNSFDCTKEDTKFDAFEESPPKEGVGIKFSESPLPFYIDIKECIIK